MYKADIAVGKVEVWAAYKTHLCTDCLLMPWEPWNEVGFH